MRNVVLLLLMVLLGPHLAWSSPSDTKPNLIVEDIQCRGNEATDCSFITAQLFLSKGDPVDEDEIANAKIRLSTFYNFKSLDLFLEKGSVRGKVILVVEVKERSPYLTEARTGTKVRKFGISQRVGGRIAHQNLFGKGKILDLEVDARVPLTGNKFQSTFSRLQYVDPSLLGSKKYFLVTGLTFEDRQFEYNDGDFFNSNSLSVDAAIGRRVWDFSYFTFGMGYFLDSTFESRYEDIDGDIQRDSGSASFFNSYSFGYGWNSEDDPYFPTRGSRFATNFRLSTLNNFDNSYSLWGTVAYRTNWTTANNTIWSFKVGGAPGDAFRRNLEDDQFWSVTYAKPIQPSSAFGGIKRGRWYVEPGMDLGYTSFLGVVADPGIKAGIRLETEMFGIIDLYAIGIADWRPGL